MRRWMLVVALASAVAGCAQPSTGTGQTAAPNAPTSSHALAPRTVTVTAREANRTLTLAVGDRLELRFPPTVGTTWRLAAWPTDLLSLQARNDRMGRWTFIAHIPGRGNLLLRAVGVCVPPRLCPIAADQPTDGDFPNREGVISVSVLVR